MPPPGKALPLATDVTMFGTSKPDDVSRVEVDSFSLAGSSNQAHESTSTRETSCSFRAERRTNSGRSSSSVK